jgi:hypothetical protein
MKSNQNNKLSIKNFNSVYASTNDRTESTFLTSLSTTARV